MRWTAPLALCACASLAGTALAQQTQRPALKPVLPLESYEPNTIGLTKDSDDVRFLDVKLSLKYPVMPERICSVLQDSRVYFAATTRFAQYLGTRDSSPVVGKRFNPKLIWRQVTSWDDLPSSESSCGRNAGRSAREYVDFAFAHESNGQSINSPELFRVKQEQERFQGGRAEFARDYISRGWDYLEVASKHSPKRLGADKLTIYSSFRYFLRDGPLQGEAEEYNEWENDAEGKPRRRVQGLALLVKHQQPFDYANWLGDVKLAIGFETGYSRPFRYNTVRAEAGMRMWELPFMVFYQNGYNSDLALYYKRVSTFGIALEFGTF